MRKKQSFIIAAAILMTVFSIIIISNAQNIYTILSDKKLRANGHNVYVSEEREINTITNTKDNSVIKAEGNKIVTGAYIIENGNVEEAQIKKKSFVINKDREGEKTIEFSQIIKDGKVISVSPSVEGSVADFYQGIDKVIFTDNECHGLWVTDKSLYDIVNIQSDSVGSYSKKVLYSEKKKLEKRGVDTDEIILYWVEKPILSPNEDKIVFQSNRSGYPLNCAVTLWITDLKGNTEQIVNEGNICAIDWLSNEEILFTNSDLMIKKVSLRDGSITTLFNKPVHVSGIIPGGKYLIYQNIKDHSVDCNLYQYNLDTNESIPISLPIGYRANGAAVYRWHANKTKVVFYIMNDNGDLKLMIHDCITGETKEILAPNNTKFNHEIIPKWDNDNVIFSAGGKTYSVNISNQ